MAVQEVVLSSEARLPFHCLLAGDVGAYTIYLPFFDPSLIGREDAPVVGSPFRRELQLDGYTERANREDRLLTLYDRLSARPETDGEGIQIALGLEHEGLRRGISDAADVARREFLEKIRQVGNGRSGVRGRVSPSRAACCTPSSLLEEAARADRSCSKISFRPGGTYGYGGSSGETAYCSTIPG